MLCSSMASFLFNPGMSSSEPDLDDGSTPELLGRWTDGWSTNSSDKDDSNGLEELPTEEGDSGPADNEYEGWHGGGSNIDVSTEDHENLEKIMGEQFNSPDPVNASVLLSQSLVGLKMHVQVMWRLREKKHYERVDRKMPHKSEMRTNCNAKLVVFLDKICGKWRTETLVEKHNHDLVSPEFTNVMALHRKVTEGHKAHIYNMHESGFQTTQIMGFFAHMCGGYHNLNFISKDLYNYMDEVRQSKIVEGDAVVAISYLKGKAELDPMSVVQYSYCAEKHLEDEKILSYKWLLKSFLEVMKHKEPKVVVTDGDESMRDAIRSEFPNATHRVCTWHLARNTVVNIKDKDFCAAFKTTVYGHFDVEEFDNYWVDMVTSFGLEDNDEVAKTYEKRDMWENACLGGKFCAGIRTTSRCEDYKTLYSNPVMTTGLKTLERSASKWYTREIFYEVQKQINGVVALLILHRDSIGSTEKFMFRKFRRSHHVYLVFLDRSYDKWCKGAKVTGSNNMDATLNPTEGFRIRYGALWGAYLPMCFLVVQATETYDTTMAEVAKMSKESESLCVIGQRGCRIQAGADQTYILDPKVIRPKSAPRGGTNDNNERCCRRCLGLGHDQKNCTATDDNEICICWLIPRIIIYRIRYLR
ncbi:hypothetical protein AHAS_Ahas17G0096500 [Arachis hypogaea]